MRRLLPPSEKHVDAAEAVAADRTPPDDRPWVLLNMIASVDGAAVVEGKSGGLGSDADREVFHQLRGVADVILVAAGTVRAEGYGPARPRAEVRAARVSRGQAEVPPIAVITGSVNLDWSAPFFTDAESRPIVITTPEADEERLAQARKHADVIALGGRRIDFAAALGQLRARGHEVALLEGGPSINGILYGLDLIDELNLTIAPSLVGGDPIGILRGVALPERRGLRLLQVLEQDSYLFLRYVRWP
ncbi:MAG: pyrimidine reductase family protein [Thermoleophilia bacterium]|nr:pyrimidine reductase family protein [Thermoleophilia bacterium]